MLWLVNTMAKTTKKIESAAPASKPAAKAPAAKAPASKPTPIANKAEAMKPAGAAPASTGIDTSVAATTAAAMVGSKSALPSDASTQPPKKESAAFKQLKAGLNKPSAGALGGAFGAPAKQKKSNQSYGGGKQIGHNQTFGSDVNRAGVPRRTPG